MLDQFSYVCWVHNSFALAGYCQNNKCQPSMEKRHLKDTNQVITEEKTHAFMHCIIFPDPQGLLLLTAHSTRHRCSSSSFADWGCGKQMRVTTLNSLFTYLNFHLRLKSPSDSAESLNPKTKSRISRQSVACRGFSPYTTTTKKCQRPSYITFKRL